MTSMVAWAGVDTHGHSSLNFATDSKISWTRDQAWGNGRKVFSSRVSPDLFAYVGDVLLPTQIVGQIIEQIDAGLLFQSTSLPEERRDAIQESLITSMSTVPKIGANAFSVIYGTRQGRSNASHFWIWEFQFGSADRFSKTIAHTVPTDASSPVLCLGSGGEHVKKWSETWVDAEGERTSRGVFGAFCKAITSECDVFTGGAPQLVVAYRSGPAKPIGVITPKGPFLHGAVISTNIGGNVEWRNYNFERCDASGALIKGAQKQPPPTRFWS